MNRSRRALVAVAASTVLAMTASTFSAGALAADQRGAAGQVRPSMSIQPDGPVVQPGPKTAYVKKLKISDAVMDDGTQQLPGKAVIKLGKKAFFDKDAQWPVMTKVRVNGKKRGRTFVNFRGEESGLYPEGVEMRSKYGAGKVKLGPTKIYIFKNGKSKTVVDKTTTTFFFRRDTSGHLAFERNGKKVTFHLTGQVVTNNGGLKSAKEAKVLVRRGGQWELLKKVTLKNNGTAEFTKKVSSLRSYRLVIPQTKKIQGIKITKHEDPL